MHQHQLAVRQRLCRRSLQRPYRKTVLIQRAEHFGHRMVVGDLVAIAAIRDCEVKRGMNALPFRTKTKRHHGARQGGQQRREIGSMARN